MYVGLALRLAAAVRSAPHWPFVRPHFAGALWTPGLGLGSHFVARLEQAWRGEAGEQASPRRAEGRERREKKTIVGSNPWRPMA